MKEYLLNKISIRLNVGPDLHQPNARKARVQFSYKPKKAWYWKVAKRIFYEVSFVNMSPNVSYSWAGARPKPASLSPMNPKAQKVKKLQLLISEKAQKVPEINSDWTLPSPFHRCLIAPREKKYHQVDPFKKFDYIFLSRGNVTHWHLYWTSKSWSWVRIPSSRFSAWISPWSAAWRNPIELCCERDSAVHRHRYRYRHRRWRRRRRRRQSLFRRSIIRSPLQTVFVRLVKHYASKSFLNLLQMLPC